MGIFEDFIASCAGDCVNAKSPDKPATARRKPRCAECDRTLGSNPSDCDACWNYAMGERS